MVEILSTMESEQSGLKFNSATSKLLSFSKLSKGSQPYALLEAMPVEKLTMQQDTVKKINWFLKNVL